MRKKIDDGELDVGVSCVVCPILAVTSLIERDSPSTRAGLSFLHHELHVNFAWIGHTSIPISMQKKER